jgi:uncharacterized membrane protein YdbT with pleckstrin-like domain
MPNLLAGESMVLPPIRKHWIVFVKGMQWPLVLTVLVLAVVDGLLAGSLSGDFRVLFTLLALGVLGLLGYGVYYNWRIASLTVTDQRVILEEGVLIRTTKVIPLDRVQDVSTKQNLFGQFFDYGSIEIDTAGAIPNELFTYAARPELLRDQVFMLSEQLRRGL